VRRWIPQVKIRKFNYDRNLYSWCIMGLERHPRQIRSGVLSREAYRYKQEFRLDLARARPLNFFLGEEHQNQPISLHS
jgi:hypothetical protein